MAFFRPQQQFYSAPQPNFHGLFRLLDDFDRYSSQSGGSSGSRHSIPTFTPKFDMRESEAAYELHGELPGIDKKDVHIEFTDPQTLLIRGKVERTHTEGDVPAGLLEGSASSHQNNNTLTEAGEQESHHDEPATTTKSDEDKSSHHHASVEDAPEDDDYDDVSSQHSTPAASTSTEVQKHQQQSQQKQQAPKPAAPKHKYYLVERNIGQFSRSFNFPSRIDPESVSARLDNGILTVSVQKAKKHESRRIAIN